MLSFIFRKCRIDSIRYHVFADLNFHKLRVYRNVIAYKEALFIFEVVFLFFARFYNISITSLGRQVAFHPLFSGPPAAQRILYRVAC
jgi:hypothetical protein